MEDRDARQDPAQPESLRPPSPSPPSCPSSPSPTPSPPPPPPPPSSPSFSPSASSLSAASAAATIATADDDSSSSPQPPTQPQEIQGESELPENPDDNAQQNPSQERQQQQGSTPSPRPRVNASASDAAITSRARKDAFAVVVLLIMFWFCVSIAMFLVLNGPDMQLLGPNCSRLIQLNTLFVQSIEVEELHGTKPELLLYGFHKPPPLDQEITWTEAHNTSIPTNYHEEWLYFLNEGSKIDVLFNVKSPGYQTVMLAIVQGGENLVHWIKDPSYLNATLSWYLIHGTGRIKQEIMESFNYYIAVANMYSEVVEIELEFTIKSVIYNTTEAYYKCSLGDRLCSFKLSLHGTPAAVLTSPAHIEDSPLGDGWYVRLSYRPRWITYAIVSGLVTMMMAVSVLCCLLQTTQELRAREMRPEIAPLLNDDDALGHGSPSLSLPDNEEDLESSPEGFTTAGGCTSHCNIPAIKNCVVCFDAPRNSVFHPCRHYATCITCAKRIDKEIGKCPICRKKLKCVQKI